MLESPTYAETLAHMTETLNRIDQEASVASVNVRGARNKPERAQFEALGRRLSDLRVSYALAVADALRAYVIRDDD